MTTTVSAGCRTRERSPVERTSSGTFNRLAATCLICSR